MGDYIYVLLIVVAVIFLTYLWLENTKEKNKSRRGESFKSSERVSFPLRMQAYERLALFLERSKPQSLLMRFFNRTEEIGQLQILLLNTVREEFEHNFSQQIYVSESLWQTISLAKDRLVQLVNTAALQQKTTKGFAEELLLQYSDEQEDFIGEALQMLRKEARSIQK